MMAAAPQLQVIVDTREQAPWKFERFGFELLRVGLSTGDYALAHYPADTAIERKSLADFVGSVTFGRERFWRELDRLLTYQYRAVIIEGSQLDVAERRYTSNAHPKSILASANAIETDFGIPVVWASTRTIAEWCAGWRLERWHKLLAAEELKAKQQVLQAEQQ